MAFSSTTTYIDGIENHFEILGKLGAGSFAEVYKVRTKSENQDIRAVKKIILSAFEEDDATTQVERLKELKSDHIIEYYDCLREEEGNKIVFYVVMHFCKGNLRDLLKKQKIFSSEQCFKLLIQITIAMLLLNSNKVMHLDLKPENILYENENYFKICDFGCSKLMETESSLDIRQITDCAFGTPRYISPQIKLNKPQVNMSSCDIWSLGIILYEMFYKKHPFSTNPKNGEVSRKQLQEFMKEERHIQFPQMEKQYPVKVLKQMLNPNVKERITWRRLKQKLIKDYGRHQIEFQPINQVYEKLRKSLLIYFSITYMLKDNLEQNPNPFWEQETKELQGLANALSNMCYLHSLNFSHLFGHKFEKLNDKKYKQFEFYQKNFTVEEKKLAEQKQVPLSTLKELKEKEETVRNLCEKIFNKLNEFKEEELWGSMEKLKVFCGEAKKVDRYFCAFDQMPQTIEKFQIK